MQKFKDHTGDITAPKSLGKVHLSVVSLPHRGSLVSKKSQRQHPERVDVSKAVEPRLGMSSLRSVYSPPGSPIWGYVATIVSVSIAYEIFGIGH